MAEIKVSVPDIHVGNTILQYLKDSGKTQVFLAKQLNLPTSNLTRILRRKSIETNRLFHICLSLDYNFFAILGDQPEFLENYSIGEPEIGLHIEKRLVEIKMMRSDFASALGIKPSDISRIVKRTSFETDKLATISRILNYNFFRDFYHKAPTEEEIMGQNQQYFISRLEELAIENSRQKLEIGNLEKEIAYLKNKLTEAGIEF